MMNRKRYYNSFFDQINEYKQHSTGQKEEHKFFDHHILGTGLLGSFLLVALFGGFVSLTPGVLNQQNNALTYLKTESRPAFDFFSQAQQADNSFASENDGTRVRPIHDTFVSSESARMNFAQDLELFAGGSTQQRAFLRFDLSSLTSRDDLVLKLVPSRAYTGTIQVYILSEDELWEVDTLTFESAPSSGRSIGRSSGSFNSDSSIDFDLRDALKDVTSASLVIGATGGGEGFGFYSAEHPAAPELVSL